MEPIINRFFGIFFMLFQSAQIWGNLISAYVLKPHDDVNITVFKLREDICGAAYCNEDLSVVSVHADNTTEVIRLNKTTLHLICEYKASKLMVNVNV